MIVPVAFVAILAVTVLWFGLPLIPVVMEMRRRAAAKPAADRENESETQHLAGQFLTYLESSFLEPTLEKRMDLGTAQEGSFSDRMPYRIVERDGSAFRQTAQTIGSMPVLTIFSGAIASPASLNFPLGIYAAEDVETGSNTGARFLYGKRHVRLKEGTTILRWIHAEGELVIERDCALYGRASADRTMKIGQNVEFERLHARRLEFGRTASPTMPPPASQLLPVLMPPARAISDDCFSVDGDLEVPPQTMMHGNFVVRGSVRIGALARIEGSLRSSGMLHIEDGATIVGGVISGSDMNIGPNCRINGPVVASRRLRIREASQIGWDGHPTTVTAPSIVVEHGAVVYGTVWAREDGYVEEHHAD